MLLLGWRSNYASSKGIRRAKATSSLGSADKSRTAYPANFFFFEAKHMSWLLITRPIVLRLYHNLLEVLALGTLEGSKFKAGAVRVDARQIHLGRAFRTTRPLDCWWLRGREFYSGHGQQRYSHDGLRQKLPGHFSAYVI
jgi:hypothetical protein